MNKKIVLLVDSSLFGGIESHLLQLARLLKQNDVTVQLLFYQDHRNAAFYQALKRYNCPYTCLTGNPLELYKYLQSHDRNIALHTHGYKASVVGKIVCFLLGMHCISTYHAGESGTGVVKFYNWLDKKMSFLSKNFAVSEPIQRQLDNATLLNNFVINTQKTIKYIQPKPMLNIAYVGRLSFEKGPDRFIKLASSVCDNPHLKFHVFGDGPMKSTLKPTSKNVTFHGVQTMDNCWHHIDLLIVPSREEGLPMAVLEAINHQIPVLCTPVGALPTLIQSGFNGLLSSNSSTNALRDSFSTWLNASPAYRLSLALNAKAKLIKYYSGKQQLHQHLTVYTEQ